MADVQQAALDAKHAWFVEKLANIGLQWRGAGMLVRGELEALGRLVSGASAPYVAVLGGAGAHQQPLVLHAAGPGREFPEAHGLELQYYEEYL